MTVEKSAGSPASWPMLFFFLRAHLLFGAPPLSVKELLRQLCERKSTS